MRLLDLHLLGWKLQWDRGPLGSQKPVLGLEDESTTMPLLWTWFFAWVTPPRLFKFLDVVMYLFRQWELPLRVVVLTLFRKLEQRLLQGEMGEKVAVYDWRMMGLFQWLKRG